MSKDINDKCLICTKLIKVMDGEINFDFDLYQKKVREDNNQLE